MSPGAKGQGSSSARIVLEIVDDPITRGAQAFGWIRVVGAGASLLQLGLIFGLSWRDDPRIAGLIAILGFTILGSGILLVRLRKRGWTRGGLVASLALDRVAVFGALVCLLMWPPPAYPGIARVPEIGFLFLVTVAAGLRLTAHLAIAATVSDLVGLALLLGLDRAWNPERITSTRANEIMVMVILSLCGALAWTISRRAASLVSRGAREARAAERTRQRLGAYVSTELLDHVLEGGNDVLGGRRQVVVVLFSDLRGFTTHSEGLEPEALVGELNAYFEAMLAPIRAEGGVVDKFIGDAIMAVWGVPEGRPDDALRALRAAQGMGEALSAHNLVREAQGQSPLRQGIGLHMGEVVAGDIGTPARRQYTVVGDAVNIASRLESMTKDLGVPVLLSKILVEAATTCGEVPELVERGQVAVRGRQEPVEIYSLG